MSEIQGALNSVELGTILVESGELPERASEFSVFANQGLKQYYFSVAKYRTSQGVRGENIVQAKAELLASEYSEVQGHMVKNLGKQPTKRKTGHTKDPDAPQKKLRKEAVTKRQTVMRRLKLLIDRTSNELQHSEEDVKKLGEKGYPEAMVLWCRSKITDMRAQMKPAQDLYASGATRVIDDSCSIDEITGGAAEMEFAMDSLDKKFKEYKTGGSAEAKKFCS